jgi:hypothetical protein
MTTRMMIARRSNKQRCLSLNAQPKAASDRQGGVLEPRLDTSESSYAGRFVHPRAKEPLLTVLDLTFLDLQFGGLLSGLYKQSEITELLDELYYDGLM